MKELLVVREAGIMGGQRVRRVIAQYIMEPACRFNPEQFHDMKPYFELENPDTSLDPQGTLVIKADGPNGAGPAIKISVPINTTEVRNGTTSLVFSDGAYITEKLIRYGPEREV